MAQVLAMMQQSVDERQRQQQRPPLITQTTKPISEPLQTLAVASALNSKTRTSNTTPVVGSTPKTTRPWQHHTPSANDYDYEEGLIDQLINSIIDSIH